MVENLFILFHKTSPKRLEDGPPKKEGSLGKSMLLLKDEFKEVTSFTSLAEFSNSRIRKAEISKGRKPIKAKKKLVRPKIWPKNRCTNFSLLGYLTVRKGTLTLYF